MLIEFWVIISQKCQHINRLKYYFKSTPWQQPNNNIGLGVNGNIAGHLMRTAPSTGVNANKHVIPCELNAFECSDSEISI